MLPINHHDFHLATQHVRASHPHIQGDDFTVVMVAGYAIAFVLDARSLSLCTTLAWDILTRH